MPPRALPALRTHWRRLPAKWEAAGCSRHSTAHSSALGAGTSKGTASCALETPPRAFKAIRAARPTIRRGSFASASKISMRQTLTILPCVSLLFASVLGGVTPQNGKNAAGVAKGTVGACALLTPAEIEAIQGERVEETKPTVRPSGGLFAAQCLF